MNDRLVWAPEPPTEPGWYWVRTRHGDKWVVHVEPSVRGLLFFDARQDIHQQVHEAPQWAGPLEEPDEPPPAPLVVATPGTCGGAPRLDGTRLTTKLLYNLYKAEGANAETVANYYDLTPEHVMAAVEFEEAQ